MQKRPMHGANQKTWEGEVQPKMNSPEAKKTEPIIIGGRRASGTALLLFASNLRI
jgi:hypothetical protein